VDAVTIADSRMIEHRKARTAFFYLRLLDQVPEDVKSNRPRARAVPTKEPVVEGFFEPVADDAIGLADAASARTFPILTKAPSTTGIVVGGGVGLLVLMGAGVMRYRGRGPKDRSWSATEEENEG
jgi:hypothetical protein